MRNLIIALLRLSGVIFVTAFLMLSIIGHWAIQNEEAMRLLAISLFDSLEAHKELTLIVLTTVICIGPSILFNFKPKPKTEPKQQEEETPEQRIERLEKKRAKLVNEMSDYELEQLQKNDIEPTK